MVGLDGGGKVVMVEKTVEKENVRGRKG
jgi:hypothetical protein